MKKQLKVLLFVVALLALVMMTMICVSAAADGDTEATEGFDVANYNFKVEDKDGNTIGYYINLGSSAVTEAGGAWAAVPEGGKLLLLKNFNYAAKTTVYMINPNSFTFDGQNFKVTGKPNWKIQNSVDYEVVAGEGIKSGSGTAFASDNTIKICNLTVNGSSAIYELIGAGTTYQFENTVTTSSSYGYHINANNVTLELLGDKNVNTTTNSRMFNILKPATIIVNGGTYTVKNVTAADNSLFYVNAKSNITIKGGTFSINNSKNIGKTNSKGKLVYNSRICMFLFLNAAEVTVNGGTFEADVVSRTSNMIHVATGAKNASGFDVVFTVNAGSFIRKGVAADGDFGNTMFHVYGENSAAQFNINGGYFEAPAAIFQMQNNTITEINITDGEFYIPAKTTVKATDVIDGGESEAERTCTGQAIFWYYNGATLTRTIGGKAVTNSINVTGGIFDNANKSMPIVYSRSAVTQGTSATPIKISFSGVTLDASGRLMVLSAKAASYYDVTIDNVTFTQSGTRNFIDAEGTATNVTVKVTDSTVKANALFFTKGSATIKAEVEGGSYTTTSALFSATASVDSELYIVDGTFSVPSVGALYNALVDMTVDAGTFIVQKIDADTVFDDVEDYFDGDATMQVGFSIVVDDGETHEFASMDNVVSEFEDLLPKLPDYVTVTGVTFELDGGSTLVFEGGEYASYSSYMFHVINGTIVATDATFTAPNGRIVYITKAAASADLSFTDCTITSGNGFHMFQGSVKDAAMAKFNLMLTNCVCDAGSNIVSFGAADAAKVIFNGGTYTAKSIIVYTGSVGEYAFLGGTFTAATYLFNSVPTNAEENGKYDVTIANITFAGKNITGTSANAVTYNISVKNTNAFLTGGAFLNSKEKSGFLNVALENVMIVFNVKAPCSVVDGLAENVTLVMNGNVTIVTNAITTICGDLVIDENAPAIKYAGELCRAFFSTKTANEFTYGANLYLGDDEAQSGIRFVTTLSDNVIALAKAALDAGKTVTYGTVIAPADYVVAAGAFTMEALDKAFESVDGKKGTASIYANIPAVNSLRDAEGDGVYESFSGMLVNIKEANYGRAFAAVGYVVIDGEILYSAFNTIDNARSAKQIATVLLESGYYEGDVDAIAILNKYAGIVAE